MKAAASKTIAETAPKPGAIGICSVTQEPCPLDINLDILSQRLSSLEGIAAVEAMKKLVELKRSINDCRDGVQENAENREPTLHCDLTDVTSIVRGVRQIGSAFGLPEATSEQISLSKISRHEKLKWADNYERQAVAERKV